MNDLRAAGEIERLTNNAKNLRQQVDDLTKERDALRRVVERYRWLRGYQVDATWQPASAKN